MRYITEKAIENSCGMRFREIQPIMVAACMQVDVVQPPLDADSSSGVEWSVLISADPEL